ncbi:transporter substrate-binding domain-containing protein [Alteromonas sp. ASW11-36]|uniref:Transporter substrate-binding domain-containing protein n=1 Tax=Alteromonas arenosi TaxID=3055817 RepID=A0ABT7STB3_9ALTE|nr:transporter substrate-binding domain-containing protein [Alteromonas sp. ASW11-36]MDM7859438.1 transporter substrate-binding domain-containing protein [Alteromonas sp. ASW11-36]
MDKLFLLILIIIVALPSFADEQCRSITISAHPNYPPFHWREGDSLAGASIDISKGIFRRLGLNVYVKYVGNWQEVLNSAKRNDIDFIPALKNNSERQQYLHFTQESFAANPVAFYVRAAELLDVDQMDDLAGKLGSINAGDSHTEAIDAFLLSQPQVQAIEGLAKNFRMLLERETDYFVTGYLVGNEYIEASSIEHEIRPAIVIQGPEVHNAFTHEYAKTCPNVVTEFEQRLASEKQLGMIASAIKYYGLQWTQLASH